MNKKKDKQKSLNYSQALTEVNKLEKDMNNRDQEDVHTWFGLTYASYLTVPRSVLQSMPIEWQDKMVKLLNEMNDTLDWEVEGAGYWVQLRDSKGRYMFDPLMDYKRGRAIVQKKVAGLAGK